MSMRAAVCRIHVRLQCCLTCHFYSVLVVSSVTYIYSCQYRVAQNKIPHQTICNIFATSGQIKQLQEFLKSDYCLRRYCILSGGVFYFEPLGIYCVAATFCPLLLSPFPLFPHTLFSLPSSPDCPRNHAARESREPILSITCSDKQHTITKFSFQMSIYTQLARYCRIMAENSEGAILGLRTATFPRWAE